MKKNLGSIEQAHKDHGLTHNFSLSLCLSLQVESNGTVITLLRRGSYFGEIGLLRQSKRVASVRAKSNVDAYALTKEDFVTLMTHYPDSAVAMGKIAEHRKYNLDKAKNRRSSIGAFGRNKNKSFLESVEELEKISMRGEAYKRSRTVSRMKEFLNRRNSLYTMSAGDLENEAAMKKLAEETQESGDQSESDHDGGSTRRALTQAEKDKLAAARKMSAVAEEDEKEQAENDLVTGKEDLLEKERAALAKREIALQKKELEMIERLELLEIREKNLSMLDDLDGLTRDDINLEDDEEPAQIPPASSLQRPTGKGPGPKDKEDQSED